MKEEMKQKLAQKMVKATNRVARLEVWPPVCSGITNQPKLPEGLKKKPGKDQQML